METLIKHIIRNQIFQILFFVLLLVVDQLTKAAAVAQLKGNPPVTVIKGFADFQYLENTGAAFGILENSMWFFYIITIVIFAAIIYFWLNVNSSLKKYCASHFDTDVFRPKTVSGMSFLGYVLAALAAGAIGNLIDRMINGYVVDFIRFTFFNFPIFNFADICVTISVVLLCIFFIFVFKEDPNYKVFNKKKNSHE